MDFDKPWITFLLKELNLNGKKKKIRYHLTTVRMAIIKKNTNNKCWQGCENRELLYTIRGNVNWCSHCGKQYVDFSKY